MTLLATRAGTSNAVRVTRNRYYAKLFSQWILRYLVDLVACCVFALVISFSNSSVGRDQPFIFPLGNRFVFHECNELLYLRLQRLQWKLDAPISSVLHFYTNAPIRSISNPHKVKQAVPSSFASHPVDLHLTQ